jgi:uncharacterized cupredoxin-like copper-binding protein
MRTTGQAAVGTVGLLLAAAVATGGAGAKEGSVAAASPARLALDLGEFHITPSALSAPAGRVKISVVNTGKKAHEVLVVTSGKLPMKSRRVDEAALDRTHRLLGEIADIEPGRKGSKTFKLPKGSYTLFCNLPGHYAGGMKATLVVGA